MFQTDFRQQDYVRIHDAAFIAGTDSLIEQLERGQDRLRCIWVVFHLFRSECGYSADASEEHFPAASPAVRIRVEFVALKPVCNGEVAANAGEWIEAADTIVCADPQSSEGVFLDAEDHVAWQSGFCAIACKPAVSVIKAVKPLT